MNRKAKEKLIEKNFWVLMSFGITSNLIQSKWENDYALKGLTRMVFSSICKQKFTRVYVTACSGFFFFRIQSGNRICAPVSSVIQLPLLVLPVARTRTVKKCDGRVEPLLQLQLPAMLVLLGYHCLIMKIWFYQRG